MSGAIVAANPLVGVGAMMAYGATAGAASGITERLVSSGGKSAGTVKQVIVDEAVGAATAGLLKGGGAVVRKLSGSARAPLAAKAIATVAGENAAATIDTAAARFTQSSVKSTFSDGGTLQSTIDALKGPDGDAVAREIPAIRIFEDGGMLKTRRLLAFSEARRAVAYTWASPAEVAAETWKSTATPQQIGGWFIRVK